MWPSVLGPSMERMLIEDGSGIVQLPQLHRSMVSWHGITKVPVQCGAKWRESAMVLVPVGNKFPAERGPMYGKFARTKTTGFSWCLESMGHTQSAEGFLRPLLAEVHKFLEPGKVEWKSMGARAQPGLGWATYGSLEHGYSRKML